MGRARSPFTPHEQRKLSDRYERWLTLHRRPAGQEQRLTFILVNTHSPFAISGAIEHSHNIIYLDNCKVIRQSLDGDNSADLRVEANKMLGIGMADILPTKLLVAENPVVELITSLASKFALKADHLAVTTGGDHQGITKVEDMGAIIKLLKSTSKQWPHRDIFEMKITLVMDDKKSRG